MQTVFENASLSKLIGEAREKVLKFGAKRVSQRGTTFSLPSVKLVWKNPVEDKSSYFYWDKKSDAWYQKAFVEARQENRPENLPKPGQIIFPYTYAHRSRFYDLGFGYLLAAVRATRKVGKSRRSFLKSESAFFEFLCQAGELVHLQNLLACLGWFGKSFFTRLVVKEDFVEFLLEKSRQDSLLRLASEVKTEPGSRRLVTPSFVYSKIDEGLEGILAIPCYQLFQVLPGNAGSQISSVHFHRSLDVSGGMQLDFHHDLSWLNFLSKKTGRSVGDVVVVAGDFHVYVEDGTQAENLSSSPDIQGALIKVTSSYRSERGVPERLLKESVFYGRNARLIYRRLIN